jgi:hypothetical protein
MDKIALVDRDVDEGRLLVQALDQEGFPVVAAFWSLFPEEQVWRLQIASPKVSELGPRASYAAIQEVLFKRHIGLPVYRVSAVTPDDPLVTQLRLFAGTDPAPAVGGTFLQNTVLGDVYIDDSYLDFRTFS